MVKNSLQHLLKQLQMLAMICAIFPHPPLGYKSPFFRSISSRSVDLQDLFPSPSPTPTPAARRRRRRRCRQKRGAKCEKEKLKMGMMIIIITSFSIELFTLRKPFWELRKGDPFLPSTWSESQPSPVNPFLVDPQPPSQQTILEKRG